jgi:hypothetical protein
VAQSSTTIVACSTTGPLDPDKDNLLTLGICSRNLGALTIGDSAAAIVPRPAQYGWSYRPHLITPPAPKCISDVYEPSFMTARSTSALTAFSIATLM